MEFHISRQARRRYRFEDSLFSYSGHVIFANFHAARVFAGRMNERRQGAGALPGISAGQVNALGLIDEIMHHMVALYRSQEQPALYDRLEAFLTEKLGRRRLQAAVRAFVRDFPPPAVYQGRQDAATFLASENDGIPNRQAAIEEILMLWLANANPACETFLELFDHRALAEKTAYLPLVDTLHGFFETQPRFGPDDQNLVDMLRSPAIAVPDSLQGQLEYIRRRWGDLLGHYLLKLLGSLNMISEELQFRGGGPGPVRIPVYGAGDELEGERFSPDADWMPRLVLMAKNTYVWLDQLSRQYSRAITRLDQIPDEELDRLAGWGFSGLWLIGLWERSLASARIKQLCGNPEAIASAYSLKEYTIAEDLGGEDALDDLIRRAWQRGIRLSSDMVPNHMAIDSEWVYEHPDWFLSASYPPFPGYSFKGPDLSTDGRAGIWIEDHYYDRSDAAVVFKHHDHRSGRECFIYHGNDGTSMPWNDTAQLDYLNGEVREAVIQTILKVAKRFPIIRFDAAMTLAKRHYQRLWFPVPGGGCDIPSRSEYSMTPEQFNALMPQEFWREVVDRVAAEAPDTLLLAEAFWLMEGYFVRTLGMHRVYNSAFMNLLRDEDNAKFRQLVKNTLEFDPEILKRYVNFMNNPDEETAVNQFGKGDKYFGICTLLATMPGLPMFGHGQVEGYSEKYGMEYRRTYRDEQPDPELVGRHTWQIFPLLKKRHLFSGVAHFFLFDFYSEGGTVNENVLAFSNRHQENQSLVVYHNRFGDTAGWLLHSAAFVDKAAGVLKQATLVEALGLPDREGQFVIFRDSLSGLEYIRSCRELAEKGLFVQLDAYRAHVFLDFRVILDDTSRSWLHLHDHLQGRGTPDMEALHRELPLQPVLQPLREIINPAYLGFLLEHIPGTGFTDLPDYMVNEASHKLGKLIQAAGELAGQNTATESACSAFGLRLAAIKNAVWLDRLMPDDLDGDAARFFQQIRSGMDSLQWLGELCWSFLNCLRMALGMEPEPFMGLIARWQFPDAIEGAMAGIHPPQEVNALIRLLPRLTGWAAKSGRKNPLASIRELLKDGEVRSYLQVNAYGGRTWFSKERFERFWPALVQAALRDLVPDKKTATIKMRSDLQRLSIPLNALWAAASESGYDLECLLENLGLDQA